jgi:hypothetical protein
MTCVTRPRPRSALVSGLVRGAASVLLGGLLLGLAGCDSGDNLGDTKDGSPSSHGKDAAPVATVTTLHSVGKKLNGPHREKVKAGVGEVIDPWFEGAFLGDFPRSDWSAAFTGFTRGAAADAQGRDLDLLTNAGLADRIDSATATRRRVRLNVFSYRGHPRGATAHFVLDFTTKGSVAGDMQVRGDLYLAKDKGQWRIFGYDVDQAEQA